MAGDGLGVLQASTTVVATTTGSALTIPMGTPRRGLVARIDVSAFSAATGTSTVTFSLQYSTDGTTFNTRMTHDPITASATAVAREIFIPFVGNLAGAINASAAIKLVATFSGSSVTTPTITYFSEIVTGMP